MTKKQISHKRAHIIQVWTDKDIQEYKISESYYTSLD